MLGVIETDVNGVSICENKSNVKAREPDTANVVEVIANFGFCHSEKVINCLVAVSLISLAYTYIITVVALLSKVQKVRITEQARRGSVTEMLHIFMYAVEPADTTRNKLLL